MQKERTYKEAKADGIIDTNIDLTVNTLFKKNNVFYINGKPYTIIDYHYNKGEWETDKKPIDQLIGVSGDNKNVEDDAEQELAALDESLRYGNASARGIKQKSEQEIQQQQQQQNQPIRTREEGEEMKQFVKDKEQLRALPAFLDYLLGG